MYAIILAGGSGTRLWPLSRELYPKQFLPMPGTGDSTLIQAAVERVTAAVAEEKVLVVTHVDQAGEIKRQLGLLGKPKVRLLEEPHARNTAPAIGLAAWFLLHEEGPDAVMAVLPSDHLIPDKQQFAELLHKGEEAAKAYGLVTFGIKPNYPETGYGYICCGDQLEHSTSRVREFVEKPNLEKANAYIKDPRYLWNSGMFVFQVGPLIEQYRRLLPEMHAALDRIDYEKFSNLEEVYKDLEKISIDYGILERSEGVTVIPTGISWSDLGSWEAYFELSPRDQQGNYLEGRVMPVATENSLILSRSRLVGAIGLKDLVVVDTPDALLVCDRKRTQDVKKIVDQLKAEDAVEAREHRTIFRPWGSYTSLEIGENYQVKRINVNPGARLSLQSHRQRAENWVVVSGEALVTVNDRQFAVKEGESAYVPKGARHRMENRGEEPMVLIEVQTGGYLGEDDIERYEDDYGRTDNGKSTSPPEREGGKGDQSPAAGSEARQHFERWLNYPGLDPAVQSDLEAMKNDPDAIESHFGREMAFGTGGMRGIIGPGLNRINIYIIRRATQGLADYLNRSLAGQPAGSADGRKQVAIAFDTRRYSDQFAEAAALVLAANGIKALLFNDIRPTPVLSFATRELGCAAGIVITASHNPSNYNGYKIYGPDGGQAVSPLVDDVIEAIDKVDIFDDVKTITRSESVERGLFGIIDPALDQRYLEQVSALSLSSPEVCISIVYTPLHGTGLIHIPNLLGRLKCVDLTVVDEQMTADPEFSTVRVPNPEDPAALDMAIEKARQVGAELVLATDPDGDRVGTAVRNQAGDFVILSGNQVGALLIEYICSRRLEKGVLPLRPVMIKTIVTGNLGRKVAEAYGLQVVETLTGFKFIGDKMKEFENIRSPNFVFGYEESCGYLTGTFVRDKDGVIASFLIAEMAAYYKDHGKNLLQVLDEMQQLHGYHSEDLLTVELEDISEADRHVAAYRDLPPEIAGLKMVEKRDYEQGKGWNLRDNSEFELTLPESQVLHYTLEDGSWFAVRPSGTEPKVKFYLSVTAPTAVEAGEKLAALREAVLAQA